MTVNVLNPMLNQRLMARLLIGAVLGAVPGFIVLACGYLAQGVGLIMGECFIAGLLAIPDVSPRRVFRLFVTVIVAKNIPFVQEGLVKWVDGDNEWADETPFTDAFSEWLFVKDVSSRGGWVVASGLLMGVLFGVGIVLRDLSELKADRPAVTLPIRNAKDSLEAQAVLIAIGIAIWMTAGCGLLASPAFRRPILIGGSGSLYLGTCVGLLGNFNSLLALVLFLTSACLAVALLVGAISQFTSSSDSGP